jgi:hypothetical protein
LNIGLSNKQSNSLFKCRTSFNLSYCSFCRAC